MGLIITRTPRKAIEINRGVGSRRGARLVVDGTDRGTVDVPTREEALKWAAKTAAACRCAQDVRKFGYDPEA
jgi:hypothetical protein